MGTVEKLTLENMGVAFGILSLGGTETEIHLGGHLLPIATYVLKNTIATLGLKEAWFCSRDPFLPRDAMLSAVYAVVVCLCVCDLIKKTHANTFCLVKKL